MMTFEDALEIAIDELWENAEHLRATNKGYESRVEAQCNQLLTARNVLKKELDGMQAQVGE